MSDARGRWDRVREAFSLIEDAPEAERSARLAALAPDIRAEVESLRAAADRAPAFLNMGAQAITGSTVGPYRLGAEIGRGGMGVVFRADRGDGEFNKAVAIKIATGHLFGPELERRFIQERQILAQLDHPHIVRLLDGGITNGQRYFVMELAEGQPLTTYCRERSLDARARLQLVRDVCAAIHYAHQRLILHRDLKPGNIVVTADGVVKVLDFGIAQLVRPDDSVVAGETTATGVHPYSLSCASPEQLRGERLSLASDIYSLGVLLYELLTGVNPQHKDGDTFDQTYRRAVDEPATPPSALAPGLSRDLDAITLKSLAKKPEERYASVAELDADIARHLTGRPVLAVPPRATYVVSRFVKRNRALTTTIVALLVVAGVGASTYIRQAQRERRRFEDARKLVHSVIFDIQPKLEAIAGTLPLRQTLVEQTMTYLESVSADAGDDVALLHELSKAYHELARLQGDISVSNLGNLASASQRYARADALMQRALAVEPSNPDLLADAGALYARLSGFDASEGRKADAMSHARLGVRYAQENLRLRPRDVDARDLVALSTFFLALATPEGEPAEKIALYRSAAEAYEALATENPDSAGWRRSAAITWRYVASLQANGGEYTKAVEFARRSLAAIDGLLTLQPDQVPTRLEVATGERLLAIWMTDAGQVAEAKAHFERAIALAEGVLAQDADNSRARADLAHVARGFAQNRLVAGDYRESRRQVTRATELYDRMSERGQLGAGAAYLVASLARTQGNLERADGTEAAACAAFAKARRLFEEADRLDPLSGMVKRERDDVVAKSASCR